VVLLVGMLVVAVTGLLSYAAYDPQLGGSNDRTAEAGLLRAYATLFDWPTSPVWLYRVTQGLHVLLGLALIPVVLAKLWSVAPKLFEWPPVTSVAQALERVSILLLVGSILFLSVTGVMNIQYDYAWGFSFYTGHFYGAWVFLAAFAAHIAIKWPTLLRALRGGAFRAQLRVPTSETVAEPPDPDHLVSPDPAPATISRRGALALVGGSSLGVLAVTVGQSIDPLRRTALLAPRGQSAEDFQVNTTFEKAGIELEQIGSSWRLRLTGVDGREVELRREDLLALPLRTEDLPIACVEGWSTSQTWTGVPLRELAEAVGSRDAASVFVESLQESGAFSTMSLTDSQLRAPRTLLALQVNGADLSLDHGFPARMIIPAAPGVRNTKWVTRITFTASP